MATVRDKPRPMTGYDDDFHAWALEQAALIRERRLDRVDFDNVAEEIDGLGRSQVSELRSRMFVLLTHLLKWQHQDGRRTRSWAGTIAREREEIRRHVGENPSLKPKRAQLYAQAYRSARYEAMAQTNLPLKTFPEGNPYALAQALDHDFWPGPPRRADDEPEA